MTQQLDPKQVRGLKEELDTLDSMAKIKTIGANLNLSEDGELSATGGGGGGGANLYSTLGQNIDGALTQKASTDLLAHKDDFDTLSGTVSSLQTAVSGKEPTITAGTTSQYWRGDKTWQTLDKSAVGLGNVDNTSDATKKSNYTGTIASGDTGFVTGGDVYTAVNGTIQAEQTVSTDPVTATVTTDDITTSAVTTPKIADGAVTTAKIASGAVTASNIDFATLGFGNYSTSEVDTGFTWIDGSHIYKKTITHTTGIAAGANTNISHGISNIGIVVKKEIIGYSTDTGATIQIPAATFVNTTPGGNNVNSWTVSASSLSIYSSLAYTDTVYVTLYYTKTS